MRKGKLRALLIERDKESNELVFDVLEINRAIALNEYYKYLECDTIDIQERYINGKVYDFIFDDEYLINGKAKEPVNMVAFGILDDKLQELIFGKLIICNIADENGEEVSLEDEDLENIIFNGQGQLSNNKNGNKYFAIQYAFTDEKKGDA